jgi:hypothetical protein
LIFVDDADGNEGCNIYKDKIRNVEDVNTNSFSESVEITVRSGAGGRVETFRLDVEENGTLIRTAKRVNADRAINGGDNQIFRYSGSTDPREALNCEREDFLDEFL